MDARFARAPALLRFSPAHRRAPGQTARAFARTRRCAMRALHSLRTLPASLQRQSTPTDGEALKAPKRRCAPQATSAASHSADAAVLSARKGQAGAPSL